MAHKRDKNQKKKIVTIATQNKNKIQMRAGLSIGHCITFVVLNAVFSKIIENRKENTNS